MGSKKGNDEPYPVGTKFAVGTYENTDNPPEGQYRDGLRQVG